MDSQALFRFRHSTIVLDWKLELRFYYCVKLFEPLGCREISECGWYAFAGILKLRYLPNATVKAQFSCKTLAITVVIIRLSADVCNVVACRLRSMNEWLAGNAWSRCWTVASEKCKVFTSIFGDHNIFVFCCHRNWSIKPERGLVTVVEFSVFEIIRVGSCPCIPFTKRMEKQLWSQGNRRKFNLRVNLVTLSTPVLSGHQNLHQRLIINGDKHKTSLNRKVDGQVIVQAKLC